MISPDEFVKLFGSKKQKEILRYATVDPSYSGSGRPSLIFDGETIPTVKRYPYLSSYVPAPNDRVVVIKNVIMGKIV